MRLEQLNEGSLTPEQRELYETIEGNRPGASMRSRNLADVGGNVQGPFNAMLLAPSLGEPLQQLGAVLRFRGLLPARARELVILTVARAWESEFEWWAHVRIGREAGLTDDEIVAVFAGAPLALDDPVEQAIVDAARALVTLGDLDDDLYDRLERAIGGTACIELTTLVGYYALLALQMRAFRVRLPEGAHPAFTTG